jgi:hypothetical protein
MQIRLFSPPVPDRMEIDNFFSFRVCSSTHRNRVLTDWAFSIIAYETQSNEKRPSDALHCVLYAIILYTSEFGNR